MNINKLSENKIKIKAIPSNQPMNNIPNILNNPKIKILKLLTELWNIKAQKEKKINFLLKNRLNKMNIYHLFSNFY